MNKIIILATFLLLPLLCVNAQNPRIVGFEEVDKLLQKQNDTTYIVNFWATWCGPCVKELPYFEAIHEKYKDEKVKVVLVSLDFKNTFESRLIPFMEKNEIKSSVWLLQNTDYNNWIDKVDKSWEGNIPITLIYNHQKNIREFIGKETEYAELEKIIAQTE